jgi:hypothetical protein
MAIRIIDIPTLRAERRVGEHAFNSPATLWDRN